MERKNNIAVVSIAIVARSKIFSSFLLRWCKHNLGGDVNEYIKKQFDFLQVMSPAKSRAGLSSR